jgi:hypothetical protein
MRHRPVGRLGRCVLAVSVALGSALIVAPTAHAAQTFGSNLTAGASGGFAVATLKTWSNATLPAGSTAAGGFASPINGVVVRWRIKIGMTASSNVTPRITRPGNSATRTGAGTGTTVSPPTNATTSFNTRLPVVAGDQLGIDWSGNLNAFAATATADVYSWSPPLTDGGAPAAGGLEGPNLELLINADVEADADNDGFGDETQDACPSNAATQGACPTTNPPTGSVPTETRGRRFFRFGPNQSKVNVGGKVKLSGDIDVSSGNPACASNQAVEIQERGRRFFRTIARVTTDAEGRFSLKDKVKGTETYQAVVQENAACEASTSGKATVRAKR